MNRLTEAQQLVVVHSLHDTMDAASDRNDHECVSDVARILLIIDPSHNSAAFDPDAWTDYAQYPGSTMYDTSVRATQ